MMTTAKSHWLFVIDGGNNSHRQQQQQSKAAAEMASLPLPLTTMTGWWRRHELLLHSQ